MLNMLQPLQLSNETQTKNMFDMCNFRIDLTVRDRLFGVILRIAAGSHLDPTGLMKARLAVFVPGKSIPWL